MRALSNIMTLLILNILTAVCCIPIFTAGAALSSLHYMIMKMMDGDDGHLAKRYFEQFRINFRSSTPVWLILLGISAFLYFDYRVFLSQNDSPYRVLLIPVWVAAILVFAVFVWVFPLLARFENRMGATFRNTFILMIGKIFRTLIMMALWFATIFVLSQSWRLLPLFFLFGLSLPGYLSALVYYPALKPMIKHALGEDEEGQDGSREEAEDDEPGAS